MGWFLRTPQDRAVFVPGDAHGGYYNDLTVGLGALTPPEAVIRLQELTGADDRVNPVTVLQFGLGAWQRSAADERWLEVVRGVVRWVEQETEDDPVLRYRYPMPHTYRLAAGWGSAMAQGEAASLLIRAARSLGCAELDDRARAVLAPLLDGADGLVASTPDGNVFQEYPTSPPAHVLNGWIYTLWGCFDVGQATGDQRARAAWEAGVATLAQRLPLYTTAGGWSRYDLFPHRLTHVASPYYHRLHIALLEAIDVLAPQAQIRATADRWRRALTNPPVAVLAVARKVGFRLVVPRRTVPATGRET